MKQVSIQLCLLSISVIFEAKVFLDGIFVPRDAVLQLDLMIIRGVLIGLALLPVLIVLRHGTKWPRLCALILAVFPVLYISCQIEQFFQT